MADAEFQQVVISRDGSLALSVVGFDGIHPVPERISKAVQLRVETPFDEALRAVHVVFGKDEIRFVKLSAFGLAKIDDEELRLKELSIAAVGEHLDQHGIPELRREQDRSAEVRPSFDAWSTREPACDDDVLTYIGHKVWWGWKLNESATRFGSADMLRLRVTSASLARVAVLGLAQDWEFASSSSDDRHVLTPTPDFLRRRQAAASSGSRSAGPEHLLDQLAAPRYHSVKEHWRKALSYSSGDATDPTNAAKEAVCAVESMARIVTGEPKQTLGKLISILRASGKIDGALAKSLEGVWGFASDSPGVRHGGSTLPTVTPAMVDYMITASLGAIRYLLSLDTVGGR